jgi:hypothetical protein
MIAKYMLDCVLSGRQLNPRLGLGRAKVQMIPVVEIGSATAAAWRGSRMRRSTFRSIASITILERS